MTYKIKTLGLHKKTIKTNQCSKVAEYKINTHNCCFCTIINYQKEELTVPFTTESKRILRNKFNQGGERPIH